MTIDIPAKTSSINHRTPKYISASTQSMTIGLVVGSKTTQLAEVDLTPSSPHCNTLAAGGTQCTATLIGQAGTATYALSMYSGTGGNGNLLSTGNIQTTLVAGANTNVPIALDGVPTSVSLVITPATLPVGTAASAGAFVQALDASGNIIVGPGGFSTPISLAITGDTYKTLNLSSTSVASPGQDVTLAYNGATNVGSTITPSIAGAAGTPAIFAGSGASLTLYQWNLAGAPGFALSNPVSIAATSSGTAAVQFYGSDSDLTGAPAIDVIAMLSPTAVTSAFTGDTSDPYHVPASGTTYPTGVPGMTVVHGMSSRILSYEFDTVDTLAVGPNGTIYYAGSFTTTTASNCSSGTEESGTIGALNPTSGTTVEKILKGYPGMIRADNSGNVWFIEYRGTCSTTGNLLGADSYALGEWPSPQTGTPIELPFSATGLSSVGYPADMSINASGSEMFIADSGNNAVVEIGTATLSSPLIATPTGGWDPFVIATAADGTTGWENGICCPQVYQYGFIPASKAFATANVSALTFPVTDFGTNSMTAADGSFWFAGGNFTTCCPPTETGIGRLSGLSTGAPESTYYQLPLSGATTQFPAGASADAGYAWFADCAYGNIDVLQYGAPTGGSVILAAHRIGTLLAHHTTRPSLPHHAIDPKHPIGVPH